jgi:hypothetical protein
MPRKATCLIAFVLAVMLFPYMARAAEWVRIAKPIPQVTEAVKVGDEFQVRSVLGSGDQKVYTIDIGGRVVAVNAADVELVDAAKVALLEEVRELRQEVARLRKELGEAKPEAKPEAGPDPFAPNEPAVEEPAKKNESPAVFDVIRRAYAQANRITIPAGATQIQKAELERQQRAILYKALVGTSVEFKMTVRDVSSYGNAHGMVSMGWTAPDETGESVGARIRMPRDIAVKLTKGQDVMVTGKIKSVRSNSYGHVPLPVQKPPFSSSPGIAPDGVGLSLSIVSARLGEHSVSCKVMPATEKK